MDFLLLFVSHRKTFIMEIRDRVTSKHQLYTIAREITNNAITTFYAAADNKLAGNPLTEEHTKFFTWQDGTLNSLEDIAV